MSMKCRLLTSIIVYAIALFFAGLAFAQDNSKFYGAYNLHLIISECDEQFFTLILGGDSNRIAELNYIYIPISESTTSYSFIDVDGDLIERTITTSGDNITIDNVWDEIPGDIYTGHFVYAFSDNYNNISISGIVTEEDLNKCYGIVLGSGTRVGTPPCTCDLNADGRCNMQDWLLFGQRWGATNCNTVPCACDLNDDSRCNMSDWLLFGKSWGRTNCPVTMTPSNIIAFFENATSSWVNVIGTTVLGATNYKLYSSTDGIIYNYISDNPEIFGNGFGFFIDVNNQDTYFKVSSVTIAGESEPSGPVFVSKELVPTFDITYPTNNQQGVSVTPTIMWNQSPAPATVAYIFVMEAYDPNLDYIAKLLVKFSGSATSWTVGSSNNILVTYFNDLTNARLDYSTEYKIGIFAIDASGRRIAAYDEILKFTTIPEP